MKKALTALGLLMMAFCISCSKSDKHSDSVSDFDGQYTGHTYYGTQLLGNWVMEIKEGKVTGSYIQGTEMAMIAGTVSASGKLNVKINYADGTNVTVDATIANGKITGTWDNGGGMSGTLSGEKADDEEQNNFRHDGSYSGTATLNGINAADWNFVMVQHKVSGTFTDMTGVAFMTGDAKSDGEVAIDIVYDNGSIVKASLQITGTGISGTWTADGHTGNMNGEKEGNNASHHYDGVYEGEAYIQDQGIGAWIMIVQNNTAVGSYTGDGESGTVKGIVTSTGAVLFNAYEEDDFIVNVKATIHGNDITGIWRNSDGESGTLSGKKTNK